VVVPLATVYLTEIVSPTFKFEVGENDWLIVNCAFVAMDITSIPSSINIFFIVIYQII
jgi:hypothetical protein